MIPKRVNPGFYGEEGYIATLIGAHSRGLDSQALEKCAAADFIMQLGVTPKKDHSYVHLITTGAGEYYGPNNNADYFNKCARDFTFADGTSQSLQGGLEKFHNTFDKFGAVYLEHFNSKKGGPKWGEIVGEAYNTSMHRGELMVELPNEKWASNLEKIANNKPVYWSMGCGVPYDICSSCGNHAATRSDYCEHLKYAKLSIDKEGNQTFAINDQPHFHDISKVAVPADRIAFALSKVASATLQAPANEGLWLPMGLIQKLASAMEQKIAEALEKLSEIEKKIIVQGMSPEESDIAQGGFSHDEIPQDICSKLHDMPLDDVMGEMHSKKVLLPPKSFASIVIGKKPEEIPGIEGLPDALEGIFSQLKESGDLEVLSDGSYIPKEARYRSGLASLVDQLTDQYSIEPAAVRRRAMHVPDNRGPSLSKRASQLYKKPVSAEAHVLAKEYAKYQLSFLAHNAESKYAHLAVLHNRK